MNHLGLVAAMVDELGLVECIDPMMPQDFNQRTVSIGLAVKAMILMGLGYVQRTLYLTPQFFRGKALDRLPGPGITMIFWVAHSMPFTPTAPPSGSD